MIRATPSFAFTTDLTQGHKDSLQADLLSWRCGKNDENLKICPNCTIAMLPVLTVHQLCVGYKPGLKDVCDGLVTSCSMTAGLRSRKLFLPLIPDQLIEDGRLKDVEH